ncbi:3-oxoacyl-[acyl-carrier protein] reductase [Pseudovibrio denitrificans]|uniref:3-oxoacyl-[acyl-carrier protein] reductase n=1 Tax=Pseudovibrio denitrificans TaxID=258256 RepID=A0A1I7D3P9_9HYPH|nr:SDR family NAD(P)-dependent oxidoreductase [Pseudovibrio denitrificans]SFU06328.1 3-oxoacyl-[acyl-carrier protein] reductase [Pseudovibrio denitrificans]
MTDISYDFSGKVAVVTGGSKGIGAEIAQHYHKAGAQVAIWDLKVPENLPFPHVFCRVDISQQDQVEAAFARTLAQCGQIDFLSHNAGFAGSTVPLADYDPQEWARVVEVNLCGTFHLCHQIVPHMKDRGFGRIINMASLAGKEGTPNASAYSASKAGVIGLTKSLAKELAETDIRVNCIAPAAIKTDILDQMTPEFVQIMIDKSPMKRLGLVEEAAELVMWLSSSACTFNSGAVFDLSGGRATY